MEIHDSHIIDRIANLFLSRDDIYEISDPLQRDSLLKRTFKVFKTGMGKYTIRFPEYPPGYIERFGN